MEHLLKSLENPEPKYRTHPFWSWNDKLEPEELRRQIWDMKQAGIGGFFMHARSGLLTEYLSDEWFNCIHTCVEEAKKAGMEPWCYDEEGWPSGSAGGRVCALGEYYHVRWLNFGQVGQDEVQGELLGLYAAGNLEGEPYRFCGTDAEHVNLKEGETLYWVAQEHKGDYPDLLNPKVVRAFIDCTYEEYAKRLEDDFGGENMPGFFTDEPQYSLCKTPWSLILPETFYKEYGYEVIPHLLALFGNVEGKEAFRHDYWRLVSKLFCESYGKQIYDWCTQHNCKFTGHVMMEDNFMCQMHCTAGAMPFYEYMHIPGIDWLGRGIAKAPVTPKQVSSVACQLGKKQVLSEMYALCGWDVSFDELRWIAMWQYLNGVNLMCQHLEGYTLRGSRKNDFPPSMFYQSPWWDSYSYFNLFMARMGKLLAESRENPDVLLLHPIHTGWIEYSNPDFHCLDPLDVKFVEATNLLVGNHIPFHYGDETIIGKYGKVENGRFVVGECAYSVVMLPDVRTVDSKTIDLLLEFAQQGGLICSRESDRIPDLVEGRADERCRLLAAVIERIPDERMETITRYFTKKGVKRISVITKNGEEGNIQVSRRELPNGMRAYLLMNTSYEMPYQAKIVLKGEKSAVELLPDTLEMRGLNRDDAAENVTFWYTFAPMQCLLVLAGEEVPSLKQEPASTLMTLDDTWNIDSHTPNIFLLDYCSWQTDEKPLQGPGHAIGAWLGVRNCPNAHIRLRYEFDVAEDCEEQWIRQMKLVSEYGESYKITVNGEAASILPGEWWMDRSFSVHDLEGLVKLGHNVIEVVEENNNFTAEAAPMYLLGNFGVRCDGEWIHSENRGISTDGRFAVSCPVSHIKGGSLVENGYPFFAGKITLSQTVTVEHPEERKKLLLPRPYCAVMNLYVNDQFVKLFAWPEWSADVTKYLRKGENKVSLELTIGNRNVLGPHHQKDAEMHSVGPEDFGPYRPSQWRDRYAFVKTGLGE